MADSIKTKFFIGTNAWGWKEWQGVFYPIHYKQKDFLKFYSDHFNYVELRATYYNNNFENIEKWTLAVMDKSFKICPVLPKFFELSNHRSFEHEATIGEFLLKWDHFADLFILSIFFEYSDKNKKRLLSIVDRLPKGQDFVIEVRDSSWTHPPVMEELLSHANERMIGVSLNNDELFNKIRTEFIYIKLDIDTSPDMDKIVSQIPTHLKEVYLCITGTDKIKVLHTLKRLSHLQ